MTPILVTPPSAPVIATAELKTMLGITGSDQDDVLAALAEAVAQELDPAVGGWLGRALRPATWELRGRDFGCGRIDLPYPPCTEIVSVTYDDAAGVEQTLAEHTHYRVFLQPLDRAFLVPVLGGAWPATRRDVDSARIRFTAGYSATPDDVLPQPIKAAVALGVRKLLPLVNRDLTVSQVDIPGVQSKSYVVTPNASAALESAMAGLLSPYLVFA